MQIGGINTTKSLITCKSVFTFCSFSSQLKYEKFRINKATVGQIWFTIRIYITSIIPYDMQMPS